MIELLQDDYIVGFWYSNCPKTENNWLCCVKRNRENKMRYEGTYRFRYKRDDKVFDSSDEKSWMSFESKEDQTEQEMIASIDEIQKNMRFLYPDMDFLLVQGDLALFMEKSKTKDWMHIKQVEIEKGKENAKNN